VALQSIRYIYLAQHNSSDSKCGARNLKISEYQEEAKRTDFTAQAPWVGVSQSTFGLVDKVGLIAGALRKRIRDQDAYQDFQRDMRRNIGEALWYLTAVSWHMRFNLEEIARENLRANKERWGRDPQVTLFGQFFDEDALEQEKLPRKFNAKFFSKGARPKDCGLPVVEVWVDDKLFGDPINDNVDVEDHYRYHDVLHLAYVAFLGWSPVVRKLLHRKRKSQPKIDQNQDGARARDREEALTLIVHTEAKRHRYFDGTNTIDTAFLASLQSAASGLEVQARSLAEWQTCILEAYRVFRFLREHNGGVVAVDMIAKSLKVRALRSEDIK
jgi:hypothetical protein